MDDRSIDPWLTRPGGLDEPPLIAQQRFFIPVTQPRLTWIVLGINVAMFLVTVLYGLIYGGNWNLLTNLLSTLVFFGAKVNEYIAEGEVWRLFTATVLHGDILHLLFNIYALSALGVTIERYFGHGRFLLIYLLGGLWGSFASFATSPEISVGASGAIFGLAGATAVYFWRYRENFGAEGRATLQNVLMVIGLNLVFGFTNEQIDNAGHIGGLIGGALVAIGLLPTYQRPNTMQIGNQPLQKVHRPVLEALWIIGHLVLLWLGVTFISQRLLSG